MNSFAAIKKDNNSFYNRNRVYAKFLAVMIIFTTGSVMTTTIASDRLIIQSDSKLTPENKNKMLNEFSKTF